MAITELIAGREAADIFDKIAYNGILVDLPGAEQRIQELIALEQQQYKALDEAVDFMGLRERFPSHFDLKKQVHFNPRSKKHINALLKDRGQEEATSVREEQLYTLVPEEAAQIMELRRTRNFIGALDNIVKWAHDSADGRIHVTWSEAKTGRYYTGEPPVQTMAKIAREYLIPSPGNVFYILDWRQQELRILAHLSGEKHFLDVFESNGDPHVMAYKLVTGLDMSEDPDVRAQQRDLGKMLNYALIYGLDAEGLGGRLKIPNAKAQQLMDLFFERLPALAVWVEGQKVRVAHTGVVETVLGDKIWVTDEDSRRTNKLDRIAVNYKIQGSAAGQLKKALIRLDHFGASKNVIDRVRMTIHDALLVEVPEDPAKAAPWIQFFKKVMEMPFAGFPTPVDVKGPARTWREGMDLVGA